MSEPSLFTPGFSDLTIDKQLPYMPANHIFAAMVAPSVLAIDPAGWGLLERMPKDNLRKIREKLDADMQLYRLEVVHMFDKFIRLRRHPQYTNNPFADAKRSTERYREITMHQQINSFLFGSLPPSIIPWLWAPQGDVHDEEFREVQRSITNPQSPIYARSESDGHFMMQAYTFPEAFEWVQQQRRRADGKYATYPHLVAAQVRFKDYTSSLVKAMRAQEKRLEIAIRTRERRPDKTSTSDPRRLAYEQTLALLEDSLIKDIGGFQLYVLGEEPSHLETIVTQRTMNIIDRDIDVNALVEKVKVKNDYENPSEPGQELKVWVRPTELLGIDILDGEGHISQLPFEIKVTDLRNYGLLESGPHGHAKWDHIRQHKERHVTGEHAIYRGESQRFKDFLMKRFSF